MGHMIVQAFREDLDRAGHVAAGTSTGGTPNKMPGRVGDVPMVDGMQAIAFVGAFETGSNPTIVYDTTNNTFTVTFEAQAGRTYSLLRAPLPDATTWTGFGCVCAVTPGAYSREGAFPEDELSVHEYAPTGVGLPYAQSCVKLDRSKLRVAGCTASSMAVEEPELGWPWYWGRKGWPQ